MDSFGPVASIYIFTEMKFAIETGQISKLPHYAQPEKANRQLNSHPQHRILRPRTASGYIRQCIYYHATSSLFFRHERSSGTAFWEIKSLFLAPPILRANDLSSCSAHSASILAISR